MERGSKLTPVAQNLQKDLISFYKRHHTTLILSPVFDGLSLLDIYVLPDILQVEVTRSRDGREEQRTPIQQLRDVFYKEDKLYSSIYLTAEAGYGKTAFCKRLALTWCHALQPNETEEEYFSQNEIEGIGCFSFVFLVLLGDSSRECEIDELIFNQICSQLRDTYYLKEVREILKKEKCLVLLDGLDAWTHPKCNSGRSSTPHHRPNENIAVMTTTRPWKLCESGLYSSQIDQKLELIGLSVDKAKKLKRSMISHLSPGQDMITLESYEAEFNIFVQNKLKSDLTAISPLFLEFVLYAWYYKSNDGETMADLYSVILELMLSRMAQVDGIEIPEAESNYGNIPRCVDSHTLCKKFYSLLTRLGKLAVHRLLDETNECTRLFDYSVAEEYISKDNLILSFHMGILTQSEIQGRLLLRQKKLSFADDTVQEFLAALYLSSAPEQESVSQEVFLKIKHVKDILDISNVLMFIVGINAKSAILRKLLNIINEDAITQEYRCSLQDDGFPLPLKDLQDIFVSGCKDIPRENETSLCLQDVFIDNSCQEEGYRKILKQMTTGNKQNIRSLFIDIPDMDDKLFDTQGKVFGLSGLEKIEKISYKGEQDIDGISPLLNSSIKCLSLSCTWPMTGSCSRFLIDKVTSFQTLAGIQIGWIKINHNELELLLGYLSDRDSMAEIVLEGLSCSDHCSSCAGLHVNLSQHSSLKKLRLYQLPLSKVSVNMTSLEKCCLQYLYNQDLVLELLNCSNSNLHTFYSGGLQSDAAINAVLDTLGVLPHIKHVKLTWINLGTRKLCFMNIERLQLVRVTMEVSLLRELVETVPEFHQIVEVHLHYCTIQHSEEFETVKGNMKSSQHFTILVDEGNWWEFATKKDCD